MVAALRHKCRRLIRVSIEDIQLGDMKPGEVREMEEIDFFTLLKIENWRDSKLPLMKELTSRPMPFSD